MSPVGRKPRGSVPFPTVTRDGPRPAFHGLCQPGKTHACTRSAALPAHASRGKAAQTAQVKDARRGSCARSQPTDRGPSRNASHPGTRGRVEIAAGDTVENSPVRGRSRYPLIGGNSVPGLAGTRGHPARTMERPRCGANPGAMCLPAHAVRAATPDAWPRSTGQLARQCRAGTTAKSRQARVQARIVRRYAPVCALLMLPAYA